MTARIEELRSEVAQRYSVSLDDVRCVVAPYRICPLGAHIDHQLGPVTAMAIDHGVAFAYAPRNDGQVSLRSRDFPGQVEFDLGDVPDGQPGDWGNFARGAARALQQRFELRRGLVGMTMGGLDGGGLSSSAAVGVAYLLALEDVNALHVTPMENVRLDQAIENGYLGLRNGILDQSAILFSRRRHLTEIDCDTGSHRLHSQPDRMPPFRILIAFSGLRKVLVGTDYNRRVDECAQAAAILLRAANQATEPAILGRVSGADYETHRHLLQGAEAKRAAHFFSERRRVKQGIAAWRAGNLAEFGRLMTESGRSSIENYECGSPPLADLYEILVDTPGVYGARFSGAGFRGCCVALVAADRAVEAADSVARQYAARQPDLSAQASVLLCDSDDGARRI